MEINIKCPKCGTMQKGLHLDETNGWFICSNCQKEVQVELDVYENNLHKTENNDM